MGEAKYISMAFFPMLELVQIWVSFLRMCFKIKGMVQLNSSTIFRFNIFIRVSSKSVPALDFKKSQSQFGFHIYLHNKVALAYLNPQFLEQLPDIHAKWINVFSLITQSCKNDSCHA